MVYDFQKKRTSTPTRTRYEKKYEPSRKTLLLLKKILISFHLFYTKELSRYCNGVFYE